MTNIKFKINGMHCNSCERLIENELKDKVKKISVSYKDGKAEIDFDESKISEREIKEIIEKAGYKVGEKNQVKKKGLMGWVFAGIGLIFLVFILYYILSNYINLELALPQIGEKTSLILLFGLGILTGFHCISMCGGFVVSYTAKNAVCGKKGFKQHLVYGGSKVLSYSIIGGIFGLIGGIFAFSILLRGWVAIFAGVFMIFYSLSMFGLKFFRRFQLNPKFLTKIASGAGESAKGYYKRPFITGLLNGLFIACGPLQAMYLYAAGTGSLVNGAVSLAAFGLGTLPIMIGFGSFASVISHKATKRILKISAVVVLILGLIMLNRGLALTGSNYSFSVVKDRITRGDAGDSGSVLIKEGIQEINMNVDASGYSPNSFVLKKGVPVKWNVNVKQLTGCNQELVMNAYKIDKNLKTGLNVIEFTPDKTGTIQFSCGMGMLRGSFIVTDTGEATQEEIAQNTPAKGSSCGCK